MIKIEETEVCGFRHAIRGMRNPMNSWDKMDSTIITNNRGESRFVIGENDAHLAERLARRGGPHSKFRRMIVVYTDITAPLYWWKEFDTYKVGTVANSCSTMHKVMSKEFEWSDFSFEHLGVRFTEDGNEIYQNLWVDRTAMTIIEDLNRARTFYLNEKDPDRKKAYWWQVIQLLPSSYNQKRKVMASYEALSNMYEYRKEHKLDEWRQFCKWIETLPYAEGIIFPEDEFKQFLRSLEDPSFGFTEKEKAALADLKKADMEREDLISEMLKLDGSPNLFKSSVTPVTVTVANEDPDSWENGMPAKLYFGESYDGNTDPAPKHAVYDGENVEVK